MKISVFYKLKCNILFRKHLLNLLLLFFSPRTKLYDCFISKFGQVIVLYQKELISAYNHKQHNSKSVNEIAA